MLPEELYQYALVSPKITSVNALQWNQLSLTSFCETFFFTRSTELRFPNIWSNFFYSFSDLLSPCVWKYFSKIICRGYSSFYWVWKQLFFLLCSPIFRPFVYLILKRPKLFYWAVFMDLIRLFGNCVFRLQPYWRWLWSGALRSWTTPKSRLGTPSAATCCGIFAKWCATRTPSPSCALWTTQVASPRSARRGSPLPFTPRPAWWTIVAIPPSSTGRWLWLPFIHSFRFVHSFDSFLMAALGLPWRLVRLHLLNNPLLPFDYILRFSLCFASFQ